jgi:hypothetical protein
MPRPHEISEQLKQLFLKNPTTLYIKRRDTRYGDHPFVLDGQILEICEQGVMFYADGETCLHTWDTILQIKLRGKP